MMMHVMAAEVAHDGGERSGRGYEASMTWLGSTVGREIWLRTSWGDSRQSMMQISRAAGCIAPFLLAILAGCSSERPEIDLSQAGSLRLVDETVLEQTESIFLGRPLDAAASQGGDIFVADGMEQRIVRYDRDGRLVTTYGRKGRGPGELSAVLSIALAGDTLLLAVDIDKSAVAMFDVRSGEHIGDVGYSGIPGSVLERGGKVWMGLLNRETGTGVGTWMLSAPDIQYLVGSSPSYREDPVLGTFYSHVEALPLDNTLLVSFLGEPELLVVSIDGEVQRSFRVPIHRRRGIPSDLTRRWRELKSPEDQVRLSSMLGVMHRLPNGSIALVNYDQEFRNNIPVRTGFITVIDAELATACVDIPLQLSQDGASLVRFRGDTLVTVEQEIAADDARAVMREYVVETADCSWQMLEEVAVNRASLAGSFNQ